MTFTVPQSDLGSWFSYIVGMIGDEVVALKGWIGSDWVEDIDTRRSNTPYYFTLDSGATRERFLRVVRSNLELLCHPWKLQPVQALVKLYGFVGCMVNLIFLIRRVQPYCGEFSHIV